MPLQKLQFRPGVNREGTTLSNEGGWFDGDKVRFRSGFPEKIGGWAALSYNTFFGVCRSLWSWVTNTGYNLIGVGTSLKFYVEDGGNYYDITPIRTTTSGATTFSATNGSSTITVTDISITNVQPGDFVTFSNAVSLGGNITAAVLNQEYQIQSVLTGTQYTIAARTAGSSVAGVPITINPDTDTISFPSGTTIASNDRVVLVPNLAAPGGLAYQTTYYLVNVNTANLTAKLSLSSGGSAINITSKGTGAQALYFSAVANGSDTANGGQVYTAATSGILTLTTAIANDTPVSVTTTNTVPGGLAINTIYYVRDSSGTTCKLAANPGGTAINITSTGSGTQRITTVSSVYQITTGSSVFTESTGWGASPWGGYISGGTATTLNGALSAAATSVTVLSTTGFTSPSGLIMVGDPTNQMVLTSLPSDINDSVTTIPVLSTYGFASSGAVLIDTEIITYMGINTSTNEFTGCTRGAAGSTQATHGKGAVVYQNKLEDITYSSITGTTVFDGTIVRGADSTAGNNAQIYTVTDIANNIITFTSPLVNGTPVRVATTGTTPTNLAINTTYYVVNSGAPSTATCKLAATIGGTAIDIQSTGVGTQTIITLGTTFATGTTVYKADSFPGWGEGFASTLGLQLRLWSQTNFGDYLLYAERGGAPYVWEPGNAGTPLFTSRGKLISAVPGAHEVPSNVYQLLVSSSSRITLAFGATSYSYDLIDPGKFDPMLIRWTNIESFTDWDPLTVTGSQAGSLRLSHGSQIIGAMQTRQEILVWTDSALFSLQYIGYPFVWKNELLADNISIMGPNAMSTASGVSFWMGTDKFYVYSGRVETLPCSLRQYVFENINTEQADQIFCGSNEGYSEVWWFYCSITGPNGTGTAANPNTTIDRYVIFNYLDRVWYYGTLNRTAWLDSGLRPYPLAASGGSNLLVYHEAAVDDGETNPPTAITSYVQSSDFDIGDGHNYGFVWRVIPDITFNGSQTSINQNPTVDFVVRPRYNPGAAYGVADAPIVASAQNYATQSTYNVQQFTQEVFTRIRGRQMAFRVECNTLGTQWQLGVPRIDVRADGRR